MVLKGVNQKALKGSLAKERCLSAERLSPLQLERLKSSLECCCLLSRNLSELTHSPHPQPGAAFKNTPSFQADRLATLFFCSNNSFQRQFLCVNNPGFSQSSLCRPDRHRDLLASAFRVLELKVCTTMPGFDWQLLNFEIPEQVRRFMKQFAAAQPLTFCNWCFGKPHLQKLQNMHMC